MNCNFFPEIFGKSSETDTGSGSSVPSAVIFMSGSGTNAEQLLSSPEHGTLWKCSAIIADRKNGCRAEEIARYFNIPYLLHDIFRFYRKYGLDTISVATKKGMEVRQLWTDSLREIIAGIPHDFGLLAGFIPLSNIVGDFPCLNVHPGDLTVERDGKRLFAGLHSAPVETAILEGFPELRSSVILATPFDPKKNNVDSGFILGISDPVKIVLPDGVSTEQLRKCRDARSKGRNDLLGQIADRHIERLKKYGDWKLFPAVTKAFAQGKYRSGADGELLWKHDDGVFRPVRTVRFENGKEIPVPL